MELPLEREVVTRRAPSAKRKGISTIMNNATNPSGRVTRRSFLANAATAGILVSQTLVSAAEQSHGQDAKTSKDRESGRHAPKSSFLDLLRIPDQVRAFDRFKGTLPMGEIALSRGAEKWEGKSVVVETRLERDALVLALRSPSTPIAVVHVRWHFNVSPSLLVLGDAWERSYGELGWRNVIPERPMPWYFATHDSATCHGYGVKTDSAALCLWQLDPQGVSLWLNVTNGGNGVELGERQLTMATVVSRRGTAGEEAIESVAGLCRLMCARRLRPMVPVYGANDWNYSYGQSTAETILRDTDFIAELSPATGPRPFSVIDGGWTNGTSAWPDMGKLADGIRSRNVRPGIWVRPLEAPGDTPRNLLQSDNRTGRAKSRNLAYDPTVPEAKEKIRAKFRQAVEWGYEMVKHDFSTYDLFGRWGFEMGPQPTLPGWSFSDRSRTNAEIIADLYALLRDAVGDKVLLDGCNTIGHLGQGIFDLERIGDDTSGHQWERTRRMGVNTLAFRLPQNGTFFRVDPDMAGITDAVPWELNRQWLDVLAHSGAATIVAVAPSQRGPEQRAAIREAFQTAAKGGTGIKPVDWMETSTPERWRAAVAGGVANERNYQWAGAGGASPFLSS
jgi:alpha-galactosidase